MQLNNQPAGHRVPQMEITDQTPWCDWAVYAVHHSADEMSLLTPAAWTVELLLFSAVEPHIPDSLAGLIDADAPKSRAHEDIAAWTMAKILACLIKRHELGFSDVPMILSHRSKACRDVASPRSRS